MDEIFSNENLNDHMQNLTLDENLTNNDTTDTYPNTNDTSNNFIEKYDN